MIFTFIIGGLVAFILGLVVFFRPQSSKQSGGTAATNVTAKAAREIKNYMKEEVAKHCKESSFSSSPHGARRGCGALENGGICGPRRSVSRA